MTIAQDGEITIADSDITIRPAALQRRTGTFTQLSDYASTTPIAVEHGLGMVPKIYSFWIEQDEPPSRRMFIAHNYNSTYSMLSGGEMVPYANVAMLLQNSQSVGLAHQVMNNFQLISPPTSWN